MSGKLISLVYFYLVSAISLVILFFGIYYSVSLVLNLTQFEKYPLYYSPEDCETDPRFNPKGPYYPGDIVTEDSSALIATPSAQELEKQKRTCEKRVETERKQRKLEDIRNSLTFLLVGLFLFITHFYLARKHSKN